MSIRRPLASLASRLEQVARNQSSHLRPAPTFLTKHSRPRLACAARAIPQPLRNLSTSSHYFQLKSNSNDPKSPSESTSVPSPTPEPPASKIYDFTAISALSESQSQSGSPSHR